MRMSRFILAALSLFFISSASAQHPPLVNSGERLTEGLRLYSESQYKEAIKVYSGVSRNDTNYNAVLQQMVLAAYSDSNFQAAKKYAEEGLRRFPADAGTWQMLLASSMDELGDKAGAIEIYDKVIAADRNNHLALFNKGAALLKMEKIREAKACLQQCLLINPFYASAHYYLGYAALQEGRLPEAMMSYAANLVISPGNNNFRRSIKAMAEIAVMNDDMVAKASLRKPSATDDFEMLQEIIVNKISLDKKYRLQASLEDPIVRQLQVMLEKLEYNAADKGFWMQFYVPFYTSLFAANRFEPFVYHIFSQLELKQVVTYVKRNEKQVENLTTYAGEYFGEIRATRQLQPEKREPVKIRHYYSSNKLVGTGEAVSVGKETVLVGDWEFYHTNGRLQTKGKFNERQEKTGTWEYYHPNGQLKERSGYVNGIAEGKSVSYFDNGLLSIEATYKKGERDGTFTEYYYNGKLKKVQEYKDGLRHGALKGYTVNSTLYYTANYDNDKENGDVVYYYNNGKVQNRTRYAAGDAQGKYQEYYYGGQLMEEGLYEKSKKTGTWKRYYKNGKVLSEINYLEDEVDGEARSFHANGKPEKISHYRKGRVEGKMEDFDEDGVVFCESIYEKGRLKDIKFLDKSGNVISNASSRNGAVNLAFYDPQGNKTSEGSFTKEGLQTGRSTGFYKSGAVSFTAEYKEGLLNGMRTTYFRNGAKSAEGNYTDNIQDGYQVSYHYSGKVAEAGWVVEGKKQGEHLTYNQMGDLLSRSWYLNGEQDGFTTYYHPNGKVSYEQRFEEGWLKEVVQYDTAGRELTRVELPVGKGNLDFRLFNGKPYLAAAYANNYFHGEYRNFFPDGSPSQVQHYRWGYRDSSYRSFHFGGKTAAEGKYFFGNKTGEWKYYHENGAMHSREHYVDGLLEGKMIVYNYDGSLDKEIDYADNEYHGDLKVFGDNNQLIIQYHYNHGELVSYTYEGRDGKLVAPIPLKNATGEVKAWYRNGNKSLETRLVEGDPEGPRHLYFSNGKPYVTGMRAGGADHGNKKVYLPSGQLDKEENYQFGNLHGTVTTYYPNGKIKSVEFYHDGELHGECRYYDPAGKLQVRTYFYNVMQSVK